MKNPSFKYLIAMLVHFRDNNEWDTDEFQEIESLINKVIKDAGKEEA